MHGLDPESNLVLRLICPYNADCVDALRFDPIVNRHLSQWQERFWNTAHKLRETVGTEAYYVIEHDDSNRFGLVWHY